MKKIAIITAGVLPVPPIFGGAVENIVYNLLIENERKSKFLIDIYTIDYENNGSYNDKFKFSNFIKINNRKSILAKLKFFGLISLFNAKFKVYPFLRNTLIKLREKEYDYIIIENRLEFFNQIKKVSNAKIYLHLHNDYLSNFNKRNNSIINKVNGVIVVSEYIKKGILNTWGQQYKDKVIVLYNGICEDFFTVNSFINHYNYEDCFNIVFHGRVNKNKGIDILLESLIRIENYKFKLTIIGGNWYSSNKKDKYYNYLLSLVKQIKFEVIFTGYVDNLAIPKFLTDANLVILPSVWDDPFPLVVLEAMAAGRIIISTNSGGIPEALSKTGIILDKNIDRETLIDSITSKIIEVVNNYENYTYLGRSAAERARNLFTSEIMFSNFERIFDEDIL